MERAMSSSLKSAIEAAKKASSASHNLSNQIQGAVGGWADAAPTPRPLISDILLAKLPNLATLSDVHWELEKMFYDGRVTHLQWMKLLAGIDDRLGVRGVGEGYRLHSSQFVLADVLPVLRDIEGETGIRALA